MSILGVIVRTRPEDLAEVEQALRGLPGTDVAEREDSGDGRLVLIIEDSAERAASAVMAEIASWPRVLNTSLVYEYSGVDSPAPDAGIQGYADWRNSLADGAHRKP